MKKARLEEIEILRGIAFLAVVFQHAFAGIFILPYISSTDLTIGTTLLGLIRFAVPLFVFITGVVLFYNYDSKLEYIQFIKKRFVQVIVPYFLWTVFYYVWISFLSGFTPSSTLVEIKKVLKLTLTGDASYHLWFMVMIIPFYFLFPLFRCMMSKNKKFIYNLIVLALVFVTNILLIFALSKGMIRPINENFSFLFNYLDRNFVFWVFYFMLGGFVGIYYEMWKKFVRKSTILSVVIILCYLCYIYIKINDINLTVNNYLLSAGITNPLEPLSMIISIFSIIILFYIAEKLLSYQSIIVKTLNRLGKYSFGAYLIHAFVLNITNDFAITFLDNNPYIQTLVSFGMCSILSSLLCFLISKIKTPTGEVIVGKV